MHNNIYLDYNATSALNQEVIKVIEQYQGFPLNPSSIHWFGRKARGIIEETKSNIAELLNINLSDYNIIFVSSATEANNLVLRGIKNRHILCAETEHLSVINPAKELNATFIPVDKNGLVKLDILEQSLASLDAPGLVSVMFANNETGVIQPIKEIAKIVHSYGAFMHCDAVQAFGRVKIDLSSLDVDLVSFSVHKSGGPGGIAVLVMKKNINILPQITGSGQQYGFRSGTENVLSIAALGAICKQEKLLIEHMQFVEKKRNWLEQQILNYCPEAEIFSIECPRLPNTSFIMMPGVSNQIQLVSFDLDGIAISSGSACSSGKVGLSHVLLAMGISEQKASNAIRVSLGVNTTEQELEEFYLVWKKIHDNSKKFN